MNAMQDLTKQASDAARLEALLDKYEPHLRRQFLDIVDSIKNTLTLEEIEDLIISGRINELVGMSIPQIERFANETTVVYYASGASSATYISSIIGADLFFDTASDSAVEYVRNNSLRLVTGFTDQQAQATRIALTDGVARGLNPIEQARNFRDSIGLTANQETSVVNFRRLLEANSSESLKRKLRDRRFDSTIRSAIDSGEPLSAQKIDRMVERYREKSLTFRADSIGRTEALRAVHVANEEMFEQAISNGDIEVDALTDEWITARDERVRGSHRTMHRQKRKHGEPFTTGNGVSIRFPGDPNAPANEVIKCRCIKTTRIEG